jgi:hypothetical protein
VEVTMLVPTLSGPSPFFLPTTEWAHTSVLRKHCSLLRATRHFLASAVGLVLLIGGATSALAIPVTVNINGLVSSVDPLLASFFSVGDPMTSSFTYESSVGPFHCEPFICGFDAVTAFSFTVGNTSGVGSSGQVQVVGEDVPYDAISFLGGGTVTPNLPGFIFDREFAISLTDSTGAALSSKSTLPTSVNLADFDSTRWFAGFSRSSDGQFAFVNGSVPIPDMLWPTLILMVGIFLFVDMGRLL